MRIHGWLVTTALLASVTAAPAPGGSTDQAAVLSAEKQFSAAVAANDTHGIVSITAEDWQIIDSDGHIIPRAAFLQVIASGTLRHMSLSDFDRTVRTYGNAAVVTARSKSAGTYAGSPFSTDEISTDVWIRKNNRWRCVLTQLTTLKP
jgi:ketosteroid isomerase-like protein